MDTLFLLVFVGAVGGVIYLLVFSKYGKGGLSSVTSDDPTLPQLDNEAPPLTWGSEVRQIAEGGGSVRQTYDVVKIGLPRAFPGELIAVPKKWPNPTPTESLVTLDGVLAEQWIVQASDTNKAKRLLSSAAFRAAVEPMFVKSRIVFIDKNTLYVGAKYDPQGDERALWEKTARAAAAAIRADLKAMGVKK